MVEGNPAGLPWPIAVMRERVRGAAGPIATFIQWGNLFEVTLRYLATLTLASLLRHPPDAGIEPPRRLLAGLARPSLGHWCQVVHALPRRLAGAGALDIPELLELGVRKEQPEELVRAYREFQDFLGKRDEGVPRRFSLGAAFDLLVAFRNKTKAHGAIQESLAAAANPVLASAMEAILNGLSWLAWYPLRVDPDGAAPGNLDGKDLPAAGRLSVQPPGGAAALPLFPLAIWHERDFWFLNGWEDPDRVEFLSYSTGLLHRRPCPEIVRLGGPPATSAAGSDPGLQVGLTRRDPWDLPADVAIMAQDRHRVFGPVRELELPADADRAVRATLALVGREAAPAPLGEAILSSRPWCAARFLLEAVVYDLDREPPTDAETLRSALESALRQAGELGAETVALSPLGTEYGAITPAEFADLLATVWERLQPVLGSVARLVLTPRESGQVRPLQDALSRRLGLPIRISTTTDL